MVGSPRPQQQQARGIEMDDVNRGFGVRSGDRGDRDVHGGGGKVRQYPKHRAQHMASAAPYHESPRTSSNGGWPQHHDDGGRYQPDDGRYQPNAMAPMAVDRSAGLPRESGRRVYVGNLSWEVKWMHLKDHMRRAGEVDQCDVLMEPSGRSKGCGLVTYRTVEMAREAIRTLTDTELMGRKIFVREDREEGAMGLPPFASSSFSGVGGGYPHSQGGGPPPYSGGGLAGPVTTSRVYVSNLSWSVKWQELKDFMKQAGNVLHADVLEDPSTGRSKGCGLVEFDCPEAAERAIRMFNDTQFGDRKVFIREDRESMRRPGGTRPPPSGFNRGPPPSRDRGPRFDGPPPGRGFDGPPPGRGFDIAPPRGYDAPPTRGFDAAPPRGYESGPSRAMDSGPNRGYDSGPSRGFDVGPPRGFDAGPPRGYDSGPSRSHDQFSAPLLPSGQRYDTNPAPHGYDAYDVPNQMPPPQHFDSNPLPDAYDPYDPSPSRGGHAPYNPPPSGSGRSSAYDPPHSGRSFDSRSSCPTASSSSQAPPPVVPTSKLFVGNVPFDASWQDMKDLLRSVASIDHVELPSAPDGRPKGYALVHCSSISDAQTAIARLHNTEFKGRFLEVRMDRPPRFG